MTFETEQLPRFPALRRWFDQGFKHNPRRDAPARNMVCLENDQQRVFIEPLTGYTRFGRTLAV